MSVHKDKASTHGAGFGLDGHDSVVCRNGALGLTGELASTCVK